MYKKQIIMNYKCLRNTLADTDASAFKNRVNLHKVFNNLKVVYLHFCFVECF